MAAKPDSSAPALKKALTRRYSVALTLVFCILLATFATFTRQAHIAKNDAYLVNVSGMQRMLSQRIGLMAKEIRYAKTKAEADDYAQKMAESLARMGQNHSALTSGMLGPAKQYSLSADVQDLYFGDINLDMRVQRYLMAANAFLELYLEQGLGVIKATSRLEDNVAEARLGLLTDLNKVVSQYEREAKARIGTFQRLEVAFFAIGLCILFAEIIFIFRPMVRMILTNMRTLETRNAQLREFSQHLANQQRRSVKKTSKDVLIAASKPAQ